MTTTPPEARIQRLALEKLRGRKIDVVGFMDALLDLAFDVGELRCSLVSADVLRFDLPDLQPCDVALDACRGKLRMLCARLSVICNESGSSVSPYGGEAVVRRGGQETANGTAALRGPAELRVVFKNTPDVHEFAISSVGTASLKP